MFILGFKYCKIDSLMGQLINFIFGHAKMTVYISGKNFCFNDILRLFTHRFELLTKSTRNLVEKVWCYQGAVCTVINEELVQADFYDL